jgi:hypothetical protein
VVDGNLFDFRGFLGLREMGRGGVEGFGIAGRLMVGEIG